MPEHEHDWHENRECPKEVMNPLQSFFKFKSGSTTISLSSNCTSRVEANVTTHIRHTRTTYTTRHHTTKPQSGRRAKRKPQLKSAQYTNAFGNGGQKFGKNYTHTERGPKFTRLTPATVTGLNSAEGNRARVGLERELPPLPPSRSPPPSPLLAYNKRTPRRSRHPNPPPPPASS
jgi:hypothetical protein